MARARHLFCSLYLMVLITVIIDAQWNVENIPSPSLPRGDSAQAIGFYNDTIFLLGGRMYQTSLVEYIPSTNIFSDEGLYVLPFNCAGHSQHYTQMNDKLYFINIQGSTLYSYHYPTQSFTAESTTVPGKGPGVYSCLTSYNNLLFVLGGFSGVRDRVPTNDAHVYDISSSAWIASIDSMISQRRDFCCATDTKRGVIYSIGGHNGTLNSPWMTSIEALVINTDITQSSWSYSDSLLYASWGHRAVYIEYDDSILVIRDTIQRIDCETGAVSFMVDLNYDTADAASIYIGDVLYVFGGYINDQTGYDTWQRITNPLILAPSEPTISPTELPSKMPTAAPITLFPTKIPSHAGVAPIIAVAPTLHPITATDAITISPTQLSTQAFITERRLTTEAMTLLDLVVILCCALLVIVIIALIALLFYRKTHIVASNPKAPQQNADISPHKDNAVAHENHIEQNVVNNSDNDEENNTDIFAKSQQIKSQQRERAISSSSSSDSEDLCNINDRLQTAGERVEKETECNVIETAGEGLEGCDVNQFKHMIEANKALDGVYEDMYGDKHKAEKETTKGSTQSTNYKGANEVKTWLNSIEQSSYYEGNKVQKDMETDTNTNTIASTNAGTNQNTTT